MGDKIQEEIDSFLNEKSEEEKPKSMGLKDLFEPFTALFGGDEKSEKKKEEKGKPKKIKEVQPDSWIEKTHFRKF